MIYDDMTFLCPDCGHPYDICAMNNGECCRLYAETTEAEASPAMDSEAYPDSIGNRAGTHHPYHLLSLSL